MPRLRVTLLFFLLYNTLYATTCFAESHQLKFSALSNSLFNQLCGTIVSEAYANIGLDVKILYMPGRRTLLLINSNSDLLDGEAGRTRELEVMQSNIIRVDVPYLSINWHLFSLDPVAVKAGSQTLDSWRLGVLRGVLFTDKITKGLNPVQANSVNQLFKLLLARRVDIVIFSGFTGGIHLNREFANRGILKSHQPLSSIGIYHYLHQKHADLVPDITHSLQKMVDSHRVEEIKATFLNPDQDS